MAVKKSNIMLIGMPGSGKSTVGVILAKMLAMEFVDTDLLIQTAEGRSLQDIVDTDGHMVLRAIEERVLLELNLKNHVIATGGSAAYSHPAMLHLKADAVTVFLRCDIRLLERRIHNFDTRGLAKRADQTFEDLFHERQSLYIRYSDTIIDCASLSQEEVCEAIVSQVHIGQSVA